MNISRRSVALACAAIALAFTAAACSAEPETSSAPTTTIATTAPAVSQAAPAESATAAPAVEAPTAAPVEAAAEEAVEAEPVGGGTIDIAFADGRTWSMPTIDCYVAPDATFGIFFMEGAGPSDTRLSVIESWPFDGDKSNGTGWIGSFTDETGHLFSIGKAEVEETGSGLSFTTGVYENVFDLEPSTTGTFTCTP